MSPNGIDLWLLVALENKNRQTHRQDSCISIDLVWPQILQAKGDSNSFLRREDYKCIRITAVTLFNNVYWIFTCAIHWEMMSGSLISDQGDKHFFHTLTQSGVSCPLSASMSSQWGLQYRAGQEALWAVSVFRTQVCQLAGGCWDTHTTQTLEHTLWQHSNDRNIWTHTVTTLEWHKHRNTLTCFIIWEWTFNIQICCPLF